VRPKVLDVTDALEEFETLSDAPMRLTGQRMTINI
jgi:hypothetical protein